MSTGVKSDKTFEEIVERLAALFKLKKRPGDKDYEEFIEIDPNGNPGFSPVATDPSGRPPNDKS